MLKSLRKSKKFIVTIIGTFAMFVGATSASAATVCLVHQPTCPKHLLK